MTQYMFFDAQPVMRENVRQPVSGRIRMRLIDLDRRDSERAEVLLSVPQALEVIERLTRSVQTVCRRSDIDAALHSTHTGMGRANASQNPLTHVGREGPEQQVRFEDDEPDDREAT